MGNMLHLRQPGTRILKTPQYDLLGPTDHVGVGHDTLTIDHKPGATGTGHRVVAPRRIPDRSLAVQQHLNHGTPHVRRRGPTGHGGKQQGRKEYSHAGKLLANPQRVKGKEKRSAETGRL